MTNREALTISVDVRPCLERWENEGGRVAMISTASRHILMAGGNDGVKTGENETFTEKAPRLKFMKNTLLVVDDDKSVLAALTKLLHLEGFEVLSARTGAEAVELFSNNSVDLTILDLNLGEESGWTVLERMNRIKPSVPTVIITAEFGQRANAISAGAEAFVEKPIDVPRFLETIREILAVADQACFNDDRTREANCRFVVRLCNPLVALLGERYSAPMTLSEALRSVLDCRESGGDLHSLALKEPGPDALPQAAAPEPLGPDDHRKPASTGLRRWRRGLQKAGRT